MTLRSETQPPPGNLDADPPPDAAVPTSAQLKGDIDNGRTADKAPHTDVGAAPLGTCDEAGGTPPTPQRVRLARQAERASAGKASAADIHGSAPWVVPAFVGAIVVVAVLLAALLWLAR